MTRGQMIHRLIHNRAQVLACLEANKSLPHIMERHESQARGEVEIMLKEKVPPLITRELESRRCV